MKRIRNLISTIFIVLLLFTSPAFAAQTTCTRTEAVNWVRSLDGKAIEVMGPSFPYQCVDLVNYYYQHLGFKAVAGNGGTWGQTERPSDWKLLPKGTAPEPGDIAWNVSENHVYIVLTNEGKENTGMHQNVRGYAVGCHILNKSNTYPDGLIRPNWKGTDTTLPQISNVKVSNISSKGFDVSCTVTDNVGVSRVLFPTWTNKNGQDDLAKTWPQGTRNGNTWSYHVNTAEHNNESGDYTVHIYAYDTSSNTAFTIAGIVKVPVPDTVNPVIKDLKVSNVTSDGYEVSCTVTDNVGVTYVEFPTWTVKNNQDDIQIPWPQGTKSGDKYSFKVKISDHKNERGVYRTHVYAHDADGNTVGAAFPDTEILEPGAKPDTPSKLSDFKLVSKSNKDFVVQARWEMLTSSLSIKKAYFEVTKEIGGKSVLKKFDATNSGNNLFMATIPISEYENATGNYSVMADLVLSNDIELESTNPITVKIEPLQLNLSTNPVGAGSASGGGRYSIGTSVTVNANPIEGYKFTGWFEGNKLISIKNPYQFNINENSTLVAHFEKENVQSSETSSVVKIYRLYNSTTGEHLYTPDKNEYDTLSNGLGWTAEGQGWSSPESGTAVYRLFNPAINDHLYTTDKNEVKILTGSRGWQADYNGNPLFYSGGNVPVYRLYHEGIKRHHLTKDSNEYNTLGLRNWTKEGIGVYAISD